MNCTQSRIPTTISWVSGSIVILGAFSALPAWAACTEISTGVYECTGDFSGQQITLPGDIPDSATSITFTDLTADIGPITTGGQTGVIQLFYDDAATASAVTLTLDADSNALITNGFAGGVSVQSFSAGGTAGGAGTDGRDISFASNIDISAAFQAGDGGSTFGTSFIAAAGGGSTPGSVSGTVGITGGDGGTGGTINISGSGTIGAVSGTGDVFQGINAFSPGGTAGTGGASTDRDGGDGGAGGAGGAINLAADGTWTINVAGVLGAPSNQAGVFATSVGGIGGNGGSGGDNNGIAGAGGAGGDITFTDGAGDAWQITSEGLPGVFLATLGNAAGDTGHSTAHDSGNGGSITKNSGSTMAITTSGNEAIGFLAISRGGDGVETSGNYNTPGSGGLITIGDSWDIQTDGNTAHGIAAFSIAGDLPGNAGSVSGSGGVVNIGTLGGTIVTQGAQSFGILAQSIAGHDGSGGTNASPAIQFGVSSGTATGGADEVEVVNATAITTSGQESAGIGAQATGGGGGSYGTSFESFFSGDAETAGGAGGTVIVDNKAAITTQNSGSDGIIAQSIGGAGGVGSSDVDGSSVGSKPTKDGSDGGTVRVRNSGVINAGDLSDPDSSDACGGGCSIGIMAQSVGGGGGKGHTSSGAFSATGGKGGNGGEGGAATVINLNTVNTYLDHSAAIEAQSIGGGGGQGGGAVSGGTGFSHSVGGQGGNGGKGGTVLVQQTNVSSTTLGDNSDGIHAQSIGGGGGRGGYAISGTVQGASLAVGGKGGVGGNGGIVNVCLDQTDSSLNAQCEALTPVNAAATEIVTTGDNSKGVFAHSVGGGGGNGGFAVAASASIGLSGAFAIGGAGNNGGDGGAVNIDGSVASVSTSGDEAGGVVAISAGGSGGNGGLAVAGTVTIAADDAGAGFAVAVGGNGTTGGTGAAVSLNLQGTVTTAGDRSSAVMAQSVGGGGGNGGASVAGSISSPSSTQVNLAVGGQSGSGNDSAAVTVTYGDSGAGITTSGQSSHGIAAQSIAGGGGHGGMAVAGSISFSGSTTVDMAIGGAGGKGGNSGAVSVTNSGTIATSNYESHGILAQSSGGGGGYGGMSLAGSITTSNSQSLSLSVAGAGGDGAAGSTVGVTNNSAITVTGEQSKGIVAQSIGGAGGYGGMAVTGTMATSNDSKTANVSVGGKGGKGGSAAAVTVTNNAAIITGSSTSDSTSLYQGYGILAQSVSGDGGYGGMAVTAQTNQGQKSAELAIGGEGGGTNAASTVTVSSNAAITTNDDNSDAILAQSIGGNGGAGGMTVNAAYTDSDTSTNAYSVSIGGGGGSGAQSKEVSVIHTGGAIQTAGENSGGVVAQSIGGGGGDGGSNISYNTSITTGSKTSASKVSVNVGGAGDNGSAAGTIFVQVLGGSIATGTNGPSDQDDSARNTSGHGIFALSQGGGGGSGGIGMIGSVDTSDGDDGGTVTVGGNGGSGAAANNVTVAVDVAPITTHLHNSDGILAQSIGGGGGNGAIGIKGDVETSGSKGFFGTVGGSGGGGSGAGTVSVTVSSAITTNAINSRGIAAQSIGGGGGDGGIGISGSISAANENNDSGKAFGLALGGEGGAASNGGPVVVTLEVGASIQTLATETSGHSASHGIYAQSIGGGGGNGGFGVGGDLNTNTDGGKAALLTVGATGGTGGAGAPVSVTAEGSISTAGNFSSGILAQSIGGGGGSGGLGISGQIESDKGHDIALGGNGSGGDAKPGGGITTTVTGAISTGGDYAHAVLLQSIGGGGGTASASMKGGISQAKSGSMSMILGGQSGKGGNGGTIAFNEDIDISGGVPVTGAITTAGTASSGIFVQSIGGGGGLAVTEFGGASSNTNPTIETIVGVAAGSQDQSDGGDLNVVNYAQITTGTNGMSDPRSVIQSHGVVLQSIGAGGGSALTAGTLTFGGSKTVALAAGATGVEGNSSTVTLKNEAAVTTYGVDSHALVAQTIGGGGGIVGNLTRIKFNSGNIYKAQTNVGGAGGGNVSAATGSSSVTNNASLSTSGDGSFGILAQNISGGGGYSSSLFGIEAALDAPSSSTVEAGSTSDSAQIRLGGVNTVTEGEQDGTTVGGSMTVNNTANITTTGRGATAILAQGIGGGGGVALVGGWNNKNDAPFGGLAVDYLIGGQGVGGEDNEGAGASGNDVTVDHANGTLSTSGFGASGIYAQSIGGGGGSGFTGATTTDGNAPLVGGLGGTEGDGGNVTVMVGGDITVGPNDNTYPVTAFGVFAQSVGGGGGHGGVSDFQGATAGTKLKSSSSGFRSTSGAAGDVSVTVSGQISTFGNSSVGIFAQSAAGGGGLQGTATGGTAASFGSNGGNGEAGTVTVKLEPGALVQTVGQAAHGIIAQSASGNGNKGQQVTVTLEAGSGVSATGSYAYGIWADSAGDNKGDIAINISSSANVSGGCLIDNDGSTSSSCPSSDTSASAAVAATNPSAAAAATPTAAVAAANPTVKTAAATPTAAATTSADTISPSPEAAGIMITNAATALITNAGTITTFDDVDGDLLRSHANRLQVDNSGTLIGNLHHFGTRAIITNLAGGTLYTGSTYDLGGTGVGTLINNGRVEVLGGTRTGVTAINGDLQQLSGGTLAFDLDPASLSFDGLTVSGTAALDGRLEYNFLTLGSSSAGRQTIELISADGGITLPAGALTTSRSAVAGFTTTYDAQSVTLSYDIDFTGSRFANLLTVNERAVGFYLSILQDQGVMTETLVKLLDIETEAVYAETLSDLSAGAYADSHAVIALSNLALALSSARCDELGEVILVSGQRQCSWLAVGGERLEVGDSRQSRGFDSDSFALLGGADFELNDSVTRVGAAFQYTNHSMSIGQNTTNDGETFQALVRADRTVGDTVFGAHFGGGMGWFDVDRTVLGEIMTGDYTVPFLDIGGFVSREFDMGGYYLKPRATVGLTHFFGTSTTETATGDIGLDVDTDAQTVVYFRPSLQIGTERVLANGARLTAFGGVGVTGFLSGRNLNVSASFLGASSVAASFDTTSPLGEYLADLEAGVTLLSTEGWELQGIGFGQFSDNVTAYGLRLQAAYRF